MGFWMTRRNDSSGQSLCFFFFPALWCSFTLTSSLSSLFLLPSRSFSFPPSLPLNNWIQHSVNSDDIYIFWLGGRIARFTAVQAVCILWKIPVNLAFANRRDLMLRQLCRKSDGLSYSSRIVSVSTIAFFSSISITFPPKLTLDVFRHYSVL